MSGVVIQADLAELAERIARGLSKASMLDGRAFIRTPVLFPSGSTVVVVIEAEGGDRYRLSDLGQGEDEADLLDIVVTYRSQARDVAALSGLAFDGRAFVLTEVSAARLVGAVMAVANASSRALQQAMVRAAERRPIAAADRLVARLGGIFTPERVERNAEVRGASTQPWTFDAVVHTGDRRAVFEAIMPHQTSIAFATMKFHDVARLQAPPVRVAVVHRKASLHAFLAVVSQSARVIEDDATDQSWRRAAEAA